VVEPPSTERFRRATKVMQDTAKWLLTVAAALGSVLLTGIRFSDLGQLDLLGTPFILAAASTAIALVAVGVILWKASQLLSTHYESLRDILARGEAAEGASGLPGEMSDPLIKEIEGEADFLYRGLAEDRQDLFSQLRHASESLLRIRSKRESGETGTSAQRKGLKRVVGALEGERHSPTPDRQNEELLKASIAELSQAADRVIDFADYWVTREDFKRLLRTLFIAGGIIAASVLIFAVAVNQEQAMPITQPLSVEIYLTDKGQKIVKEKLNCDTTTLSGQAVAGDLREPEVVLPETGACKAGRLEVKADLGVVVPRIPSSSTSSTAPTRSTRP
jgi:hypothetical protein